MPNPMVCHVLEGEMQIDQDGKVFTAKKNFCWTCNKDTKEQASNITSNAVAVIRITDLMSYFNSPQYGERPLTAK